MKWKDEDITKEMNYKLRDITFGRLRFSKIKSHALILSANEHILLMDYGNKEAFYLFRWFDNGEKFKIFKLDDYTSNELWGLVEMDILRELGIPKIKDSTVKVEVLDMNKFEEEIDKEIEEIWNETHNKKKEHKNS